MATGAQAPLRLGRYELLARLATGGMGEIFLARLEGAEGFEKLYVVKRILPHLADDARFRQMLIAEARVAARMAHANICQVYELSEADGQLYIVMEYLEGVTLLPLLRRASRRGPLQLGFIAAVASQICDALHYAHEIRDNGESLNIVHRDVTPANIMLTESGVAKVLDFGIAKVKNASANTEDGTVKGKYAYMAPEQLRGGEIDRRVDVFALGVVLFEMLALRRLFQRKTDYLTFRAVMEQPIPDVRAYRPDCPDQLAAVLARALERDPHGRWDTARQFGAALTDSISPFRPWTQGEIGDFVHDNFASELGRRSAQVQTAVHRMPRTTMPLIAQPDGTDGAPVDPDDDDDGFPSIETEIESGLAMVPAVKPAMPRHASPQPFSLETSTSGPSIEPIQIASSGANPAPTAQVTSSTGPVVVVAQRSVLWPIVAITAVAITAVALFLVWRQSQQSQPASLVIEQRPDRAEPAREGTPAGDSRASADGGSATTKASDPVVRAAPPADYGRLLASRQAALQKCVADNGGNDALPLDAAMKIEISSTGAATTVLSPPKLDRTELGACIKREVGKVRFPPGEHELDIRLRR